MTRDIPVGNDHFLVMFDRAYQIQDIFYPHVGMENHSLGHPFRFGMFADGVFSWLSGWPINQLYLDDTLVTNVTLQNPTLNLRVECNDCVDFASPVYIRRVAISNLASQEREVRLFFAQDFHLKGYSVGDTAYFDAAKTDAVIHYKADRYFLVNCLSEAGMGIESYACGVKEVGSSLGTWKDAEDGRLSGNPIAQGSVDSVISSNVVIGSRAHSTIYYWMIPGRTYDEVQKRDSFVRTRSPEKLLRRTTDFWRLWVNRPTGNNADLEDRLWKHYRRSLLTIRTQTDGDGAVMAANDSDILQFNKDTYSYMWPRDGAFVTMAMDEAGYPLFARLFFEFCSRVILPQGWFFHKYQADGSAGSSWHPWIVDGVHQLPLQEDETALVLIALWKNYAKYRDVDLIRPYYRPLVKVAGDFMCDYRDPQTKLPLESYDLWEERREVLTFTSSAVYLALDCAARFARSFNELDLESKYSTTAQEIKTGILKNLYSAALGRFVRGLGRKAGGPYVEDQTIDSSLAGIYLFEVLPASDPMVVNTMQQVEKTLTLETGGLARYDGDVYQKANDLSMRNIAGNPWFVTTLWLAEWYIRIAKSRKDLQTARSLLGWCVEHSLPSGVMPEQINPVDGTPVSVSPLTWSHAAYVDAVNCYVKRFAELPSA